MVSGRLGDAQTVDDVLKMPVDARVELLRGRIRAKPGTSTEHALAHSALVHTIGRHFHRAASRPDWWILPELDVQLGDELFRPDICGFRRERVPALPSGRPLKLAPDWVCEILSATNADRDRVEKLQSYFHAGVPHYWLVDPVEGTLEVFRRTEVAYALVLSAHRGQKVRAEPFDAVELSVDELLGGDPE